MSANRKIAIASDHAGFDLKGAIAEWLSGRGHTVVDLGPNAPEAVDYPDYGRAVAVAIRDGTVDNGIIICGTGIGIAIAANRFATIRAAVCHNATTARLARQHNDANVLAMGSRIIGREVAIDCVDAFVSTDYDGGRHDRRVSKLGEPGD